MSKREQKQQEISSQPITVDHEKTVAADPGFNKLFQEFKQGKLLRSPLTHGGLLFGVFGTEVRNYAICHELPEVTEANLDAAISFFTLLIEGNKRDKIDIVDEEKPQIDHTSSDNIKAQKKGRLLTDKVTLKTHFLYYYAQKKSTPAAFMKFLTKNFPYNVVAAVEESERWLKQAKAPQLIQGSTTPPHVDQALLATHQQARIKLLEGVSQDCFKNISKRKRLAWREELYKWYEEQLGKCNDIQALQEWQKRINEADLVAYGFDDQSHDENAAFFSETSPHKLFPTRDFMPIRRLVRDGDKNVWQYETTPETDKAVAYIGEKHTYSGCSPYYAALMELANLKIDALQAQAAPDKEAKEEAKQVEILQPSTDEDRQALIPEGVDLQEFKGLFAQISAGEVVPTIKGSGPNSTISYDIYKHLPKVTEKNRNAAKSFFTWLRAKHPQGKIKIETTSEQANNFSWQNKADVAKGKNPTEIITIKETFLSYYAGERDTPFTFTKFLCATFSESVPEAVTACNQRAEQAKREQIRKGRMPAVDEALERESSKTLRWLLGSLSKNHLANVDRNLRRECRYSTYRNYALWINQCSSLKLLEEYQQTILDMDLLVYGFDGEFIELGFDRNRKVFKQGDRVVWHLRWDNTMVWDERETDTNLIYLGEDGRRYQGFSPYAVNLLEQIHKKRSELAASSVVASSVAAVVAEHKKSEGSTSAPTMVRCDAFITPPNWKPPVRNYVPVTLVSSSQLATPKDSKNTIAPSSSDLVVPKEPEETAFMGAIDSASTSRGHSSQSSSPADPPEETGFVAKISPLQASGFFALAGESEAKSAEPKPSAPPPALQEPVASSSSASVNNLTESKLVGPKPSVPLPALKDLFAGWMEQLK